MASLDPQGAKPQGRAEPTKRKENSASKAEMHPANPSTPKASAVSETSEKTQGEKYERRGGIDPSTYATGTVGDRVAPVKSPEASSNRRASTPAQSQLGNDGSPKHPVSPPVPIPQTLAPQKEEQTLLAALHTDPLPRHKIPTPPPPPPPPLEPPIGRVAIVIDDFGQDLKMAKEFLDIPLPITFSVLPHQPHSKEIARLAHSRGREVLLHMPMEPRGYPQVDPGKGALLLSMNAQAIESSLRTALDTSPFFRGVNNHMGSRFTESAPAMELVLRELAQRDMFFLDSRTSASSMGVFAARKLQVPTGRRDVFLDHVQTEGFVRSQIDKLIAKAKTRGSAIAIGHPYPCTLKVLKEQAGRFAQEGIAVVPCGELMTTLPPESSR